MPEHEIYYLDLSGTTVPAGTGWLSPREVEICEAFRFPKRRNDWLLGRWTAKQALIRLEQSHERNPARWEVLADESGAPVPHANGRPLPLQLSLSHSHGRCLCTLSRSQLRLGCDLEKVEPRSSMFEETYFEPAEIEILALFPEARRAMAVTLLWSAKESVLKALRTGLSADTRRARILQLVDSPEGRWQAFSAIDASDGQPFTGWWKEETGMVMTLVTDTPARELISL